LSFLICEAKTGFSVPGMQQIVALGSLAGISDVKGVVQFQRSQMAGCVNAGN
jgi:hypothetical protein